MKNKLIQKLQGDLVLVSAPLTKEEVRSLETMKKQGALRRFGAILNHRRIGFKANCMIAWNVPDKKAKRMGRRLAEFEQISHCYIRPRFKDFPFNLYTMVHGKSRNAIITLAKEISQSFEVSEYELLWSLKELKKTSPVYVV